MNKLLNLLCNWNGQGQSGEWQGRAVLYEDGWFEGIVVDKNNSPYQKDRFVFGVYLPKRRIELLKHTPTKVSDPFIFRFFFEKEKWSGPFFVISLIGESQFGDATIDISEISKNVEDEAVVVKSIEDYKEGMTDVFYINVVNMRDDIIKSLKEEER